MTGVPTKMLTVSCSVKMNVYNSATFFGIHVSSIPVNLMYSELTVATGEVSFSCYDHQHWLCKLS
jgi:hypothetical protein